MTGIDLSIQDGIAYLTLDRPSVANSIDHRTALALHRAVDTAAADARVRVLLLSGVGSRFCAGGDVGAMVAAEDRAAYLYESAIALDRALVALASMEKPVVAAVHGAVAGAGLAVMLSCDLVIADADTRFVAAYAGVGLTPDCGTSWLLPRVIGQQRALEFLLTQRVLSAEQAHDWGMVTEVATAGTALDRGEVAARLLAAAPAPAVGRIRRLVRQAWDHDRSVAGAEEARVIMRTSTEPETDALLSRFGSSARA